MRLVLLVASLILVSCGGVATQGKDETGIGRGAPDCPKGPVSTAALADMTDTATAEVGVPIGIADRHCQRAGIACAPLEEDQGKLAELYVASLRDELSRYPRTFLKSHGPVRIWLVNDLKHKGIKWEAGGITTGDRTIYLNVTDGCTPAVRAHVIQHELYHVLDGQLFVSRAWNDAWDALNPPGFRYGNDYNLVDGYETHPREGFASSYAQTNAREDRAEVFAYGVVAPHSDLLKRWMEDDAFLRKKHAALQYWLTYRWPELESLIP
jgi:hypothetical protein